MMLISLKVIQYFTLPLVAPKDGAYKAGVIFNQTAICPATILVREGKWRLKVSDGNDGFDVVFDQFVKEIIVEF